MKKCFISDLVLLVSIFVFSPVAIAESHQLPVLRIINWSAYIDIDEDIPEEAPITERSPTLSRFMKEYGCRIEYFEYEDTEEAMKKVMNFPGFYDVLVISTCDLAKYTAAGLLGPLSKEKIPNLAYLGPHFRKLNEDPTGEYCVPFLAGTTGLAFRKDLVGRKISSWKDFFEPLESLKGRLGIFSDEFVVFPMALLSIGEDPNQDDPKTLKKAGRLIYDLKKNGYLGLVSSDVEQINEKLINGDLAMAIQYSGDALAVIDEDAGGQIEYIIPQEGGEFYVDAFVISKDAPNRRLAHEFINFVLSPEIHAANAIYLQYLCPNEKALEIIKKKAADQFDNPAIYPTPEVMKGLRQFYSSSQEIQRLWGKIFK